MCSVCGSAPKVKGKSRCRECLLAYDRERSRRYYAEHRAAILERDREQYAAGLRDYLKKPAKPPKPCKRCGERLTPTSRHSYCEPCGRLVRASSWGPRKPREKCSERDRGYGWPHQKLRRQWAVSVERGEVACARCGRLIGAGEPWDLGHHDRDRSVYTGPEHRWCNRRTKAHQKARGVTTRRCW